MTTKTYEFIPGSIASLLYVRPPGLTGDSIPCVYMSKERGVTVGRFEKSLAECGWPAEVRAQVTQHFDNVFSQEHEKWEGPGPSPRTRCMQALTEWKITIEVAEQ